MTTTAPPSAPTNEPDSSLPEQQAFMQAAAEYNAVYAKEQETLSTLQGEMANMDSWADMLVMLGTLSCLLEWMSATQVFTESCASALGGLMQEAEDIFTDGVNYITQLSEQNGQDPAADGGIPLVDPSVLNSTYTTQVANAQTFIDCLQDIYWDVSGAPFVGNNPLAGISESVENTLQDIMYQMVSTFNEMYNNVSSGSLTGAAYVPPSGGTGSSGTYSSNGNGGNYLFDPTQYADSGDNSSLLNGASGADIVCYAMLNWFYTYADPVEYADGVTTQAVYAPVMTQNPDAYQATTDFQTFTTTVMGVSQQVLPMIAFLSNMDKNTLSLLYDAFKTIASTNKDIIANSRAG